MTRLWRKCKSTPKLDDGRLATRAAQKAAGVNTDRAGRWIEQWHEEHDTAVESNAHRRGNKGRKNNDDDRLTIKYPNPRTGLISPSICSDLTIDTDSILSHDESRTLSDGNASRRFRAEESTPEQLGISPGARFVLNMPSAKEPAPFDHPGKTLKEIQADQEALRSGRGKAYQQRRSNRSPTRPPLQASPRMRDTDISVMDQIFKLRQASPSPPRSQSDPSNSSTNTQGRGQHNVHGQLSSLPKQSGPGLENQTSPSSVENESLRPCRHTRQSYRVLSTEQVSRLDPTYPRQASKPLAAHAGSQAARNSSIPPKPGPRTPEGRCTILAQPPRVRHKFADDARPANRCSPSRSTTLPAGFPMARSAGEDAARDQNIREMADAMRINLDDAVRRYGPASLARPRMERSEVVIVVEGSIAEGVAALWEGWRLLHLMLWYISRVVEHSGAAQAVLLHPRSTTEVRMMVVRHWATATLYVCVIGYCAWLSWKLMSLAADSLGMLLGPPRVLAEILRQMAGW